MSKVQKDRLLSLSIKEKKLIRLIYNNDLNDQDSSFLNRIYEEKQSLHFYYGIGIPLVLTLGVNAMLFRTNSRWLQVAFCGLMGTSMHLSITNRINQRFTKLISPYYEKYQIN